MLAELAVAVLLAAGEPPEDDEGVPVFDPPAEAERVALKAQRATGPLTLDGVLDEADWASAVPTAGFVQTEPTQGAPARHGTMVRVLFDDDALYVGAQLDQPGGFWALNQKDLRRDFSFDESDCFSVVIDGVVDGRTGAAFSTNPFGAQRDEQIFDDLRVIEWDTVWTVKTSRSEAGWVAEFAIPWKSLRHGGGHQLGLQFVRRERATSEDTVWSPVPRVFSPFRVAYAGRLTEVRAGERKLDLQLRPYAVARLGKVGSEAATIAPTVGGEATWAPTPGTVVDLTVNTDFAETDVDRRVVNLSRFSVLLPERRQFFLESASVFESSGGDWVKPFFSRTIGLSGAGRAVPISFGARVISRSRDATAGALVVHTMPTADEPASLVGVARGSLNVSDQSRLGGMLVSRHDFASAEATGTTNLVPVLDGVYRRGAFSLQGALMGSGTYHAGTTDRLGGAAVLEARLDESWGTFLVAGVGLSKDFETRAGFVGRPNTLGLVGEGELDLRFEGLHPLVRSFAPSFEVYSLWFADSHRLQEVTARVDPLSFLMANGDLFSLYGEFSHQALEEAFEPVEGVEFAEGEYENLKGGLTYRSNPSRKVTAVVDASAGTYYGAVLGSAVGKVSVQPVPHLSVSGGYSLNSFGGPVSAMTHLFIGEARVAVSPRLQLVGSYQLDTNASMGLLNARLAWEFLPLSFFYLVVTDRRGVGATELVPETQVAAKLSYTWRL